MNPALIKRDIIVIGASAGGVVLHRGTRHGGDVSAVYGKEGRIRVRETRDDDWLGYGTL